MTITKHILVELTGYRLDTVDVAQGDRMSRAVSCRLTENGIPWMVPEDSRAEVAYELPDGTPGRYGTMPDGSPAGEIAGNIVTVRLSDRITAQTGAATVSVVLLGADGAQLATWPIRVNVVGPRKLTGPEQYPQLGAEFEGMILFVSGGVVTPLQLGPGLRIENGVLYVSGGTDAPDTEIPVSVTAGEDGTILVAPAELVLDSTGTIAASVPVTLADDGTIFIGGEDND